MARLNDVTRDQLAPEHQEFFDSIASSRGSVRGPYGVLLNSPDLAARVAHTGAYVRFDLDISEAQKELSSAPRHGRSVSSTSSRPTRAWPARPECRKTWSTPSPPEKPRRV